VRTKLLAVGLIVFSGGVSAQQVYKCVNGKQVSYQSDPCPGTAVKSWDATPEPVNPYLEQRLDAMRQEQAQRHVARPAQQRAGQPVGHSIQHGRNRNECDSAKADRAAAYEQLGVRRTFSQSSYWDNRVQQACM